MKITINIPEEFEEHWNTDRFEDSLNRLKADTHCLAGRYERETVDMLIDAFKKSKQDDCKSGYWIRMSDSDGEYYCCSVCGENLPRYVIDSPTYDNPFPEYKSIDKTDFCPSCGMKMENDNDRNSIII